MGYTTEFSGSFTITPPLNPAQIAYLTAFSHVRHMKRDPLKTALLSDPLRIAVGLPIGPEGSYHVNGTNYGIDAEDVLKHNYPPTGQPSLYCQWVLNEDGTELAWDENEKFYDYTEWLEYLIKHFFAPWGRTLNGSVSYEGEDHGDVGIIEIRDNTVKVRPYPLLR